MTNHSLHKYLLGTTVFQACYKSSENLFKEIVQVYHHGGVVFEKATGIQQVNRLTSHRGAPWKEQDRQTDAWGGRQGSSRAKTECRATSGEAGTRAQTRRSSVDGDQDGRPESKSVGHGL